MPLFCKLLPPYIMYLLLFFFYYFQLSLLPKLEKNMYKVFVANFSSYLFIYYCVHSIFQLEMFSF